MAMARALAALWLSVAVAGAPHRMGTIGAADAGSDRVGTISVAIPGAPLWNGSTVVSQFVLDGIGAIGENASFALSDNARFARASWDCGAWGTQGGVIAEKLLSLGSASHLRLVRRWLLNNPQLPSGEVFSTEGGLYHAGNDGKAEANAEFIIGAAAYARHCGDARAAFSGAPHRLVCAVVSGGARFLVSGAGVSDGACSMKPLELQASAPELFATTMNAAYTAHTEGAAMPAAGVALFQCVSLKRSATALLLPLRQYKPMHASSWSATAMLWKSGKLLETWQSVNVSAGADWTELRLRSAPLPAGEYRLELWPCGDGGRSQSVFTSPAWVSSLGAASAAGGSMTFAPGTQIGKAATEMLPSLGQRLSAAMAWQRSLARKGGRGVLVLKEAQWRGVGADDVGASGAMWDLLRAGYLDSYLNVRYLQSIRAMLDLQTAKLTKQVVAEADLHFAKADFVDVFGTNASTSYISWIGCDRVSGNSSDCGGADGARFLKPVGVGFLPSLASAAYLDVRSEGPGAAGDRFAPIRDLARNVSGRFRTNTIPVEEVNVTLWRASSKWKHRDAAGFARRANGSGGDWQIFGSDAAAQDGYGQFGLTEENGGIIAATSGFVFKTGPYPELWTDFKGASGAMAAAALQLQLGAAGTRTPLLADQREYQRSPINNDLVKDLCMEARRLEPRGPETNKADRWGEHWCGYYKSVSWNLPGAGAFAFAFVQGMLHLEIPLAQRAPAVVVRVYGLAVPLDGDEATLAVPAWAAKRWPPELAKAGTEISSLFNVAGALASLSCTVHHAGGMQLRCSLVG